MALKGKKPKNQKVLMKKIFLHRKHKIFRLSAIQFLIVAILSSCSWINKGAVFGSVENYRYEEHYDSAPQVDKGKVATDDAVVTLEKPSKAGNPKSYTIRGKTYRVMKSADGFTQTGEASWYGSKFHGHKTANGEVYDMYKMTAAHKTLPLPSFVKVTNLANGKTVVVRVNDRGPFHGKRIIDLSYAAAKKIGIGGVGKVKIEVLNPLTYNKGNYKMDSDKQAFLQIGAFSKQNVAEESCKKINNLGFGCRIIMSDKLYKVQAGGFKDAKSLALATQDLKKAGWNQAVLVLEAK